jgi:hypothetical protein
MELTPLMEWTFVSEAPPTAEIKEVLLDGEQIHAAYRTLRDMAVVTDKRIVIADKQGLTGKKVEIYTIPFKSIVMYSSENAGGLLDFNAELQLWTRAGMFKLKLRSGVDIRKLDRIIAKCIL